MKRQEAWATCFSLALHLLIFSCALALSHYAVPNSPAVALSLSILPAPSAGPEGGGAHNAQPAAPPARKEIRQPEQPEKKTAPKQVVKKKDVKTVKKNEAPPRMEKKPAAEAVPVAEPPAPEQEVSREKASSGGAPSSPAAATGGGPGNGRPQGAGGLYTAGQLDGPLAALSKSPPDYPPSAKRRNIEGWIKIKFVVDEQGRVHKVSVLAAEPEGVFEQSVLRCVNTWRFKPGTIKGTAVKVLVEQTITFKLEG